MTLTRIESSSLSDVESLPLLRETLEPAGMRPARAYGLLLLMALLFCIYALSNAGRLHIVDEASLFAVTESLGLRGEVDTNAIAWTQWVNSPGEVLGAFGQDGEVYSKKGPAPAFLAVPWYLLLRLLTLADVQIGMLQVTLLWNGVVTALTAALLWLTAVRLGYRDRVGLALALLFGLATIAWPYAKQFFGEPVSAFSLLLCFYGILSWKRSGGWAWMLAAGAGAGIAVATVTAHALLVAVLALYAVAVWLERRRTHPGEPVAVALKAAAAFVLPLAAAGGLLLLYNYVRFGSITETGYHFDSGEGFATPIWQGFWGLVFSPYRGVFYHTPLLLASLVAFVPFLRRHRWEAVAIATLSIVLVGLYSAWWMWWGGYAWGPRFLVPLTPLWLLVQAPLVDQLVIRRPRQAALRRRWMLTWAYLALAGLSLLVQIGAAGLNFVNYETLLRTEYFATDWTNPLAFGPPAQAITDFFLSPVFGQLRLIAQNGITPNSDVAWLWPDGTIPWTLLLVGAAAVVTLGWLLARWTQALLMRRPEDMQPSVPMLALTIAIPMVTLGAWASALSRETTYGTAGQGYRAVLADICAADRAGDSIVSVAPFGYHIPMNWLASECGRGLPVYGYATSSIGQPETQVVMQRVVDESDRILFVTAGISPNDPENPLERWLADNAYKADDRWFDDYRLLRYATGGKLALVQWTPHGLYLNDGAQNRVTIVASRVPPSARPGEILPIDLQYMLHVPATSDLRWFVQALSPEGVAVAQLDTGPLDNYTGFTTLPANDLLVEKAGLQLPPDLEPGSYQIIAGLYNPAADGSPRLRASDGREYLVLSTLEVGEE